MNFLKDPGPCISRSKFAIHEIFLKPKRFRDIQLRAKQTAHLLNKDYENEIAKLILKI